MADNSQQRQNSLVYLTIVTTSVSVLVVLLRSVVRFIFIRNPGMDDYTIILALIFTVGYMLEILMLKETRIGFPASTLSLEMLTTSLKITLAVEGTYYMIVGMIKTSILYLYLRFAAAGKFRVLCQATIGFQISFTLVSIGVTFSQCSPIEKMWDLTGSQPGFCINTTAFFYTTSGINIITDIWILTLPIKTLSLINRSTKEKLALAAIFGVGTFAAIMSVVRLHSIYLFTLSTDPSRDAIEVNIWSMLEVNTAILCASVPALKPLFTWKKVQELRRPSKFSGPASDPSSHGTQQQQKQRSTLRKTDSAVVLYPDLEAFDLTVVSRSGSPSMSGKRPEVEVRPWTSDTERCGSREEFSVRKQEPSHMV